MQRDTTWRVLFGLVLVATCTASGFYYSCGWEGGRVALGFRIQNFAFWLLFAPILSFPFWAVAAIPFVLMECSWGYRNPMRRISAGDCATCGYAGAAIMEVCSECGNRPTVEVRPKSVRRRAFGLATLLGLLGAFIGTAASETWLHMDELAFRRETRQLQLKAGVPTSNYRPRWWPGRNNALIYDPVSGYRGEE